MTNAGVSSGDEQSAHVISFRSGRGDESCGLGPVTSSTTIHFVERSPTAQARPIGFGRTDDRSHRTRRDVFGRESVCLVGLDAHQTHLFQTWWNNRGIGFQPVMQHGDDRSETYPTLAQRKPLRDSRWPARLRDRKKRRRQS